MRPLHEQKVLILHPFLNFYGGAEYLLKVVANKIIPQADIYTFSYNDKVLTEVGIDKKRIISPLGGSIFAKMYRQATPLYPSMIDTLSFENYDLVLSFSYCYVHGLVTGQTVPHISYIQTPMRLLWLGASEYYWYDRVPLVREIYRSILSWQRVWDRQAAMRPDYLLANSSEVQKRIQTFWGRSSEVLYPPVDTNFYKPEKPVKKEDYFITHSRLVRHKRIDLLIEACREQKKKLIIVGDGPDYKRLKKVAQGSSDIQFTGHSTHKEKRDLLQHALGFLFAAEEDFGIAPVEAMAAGLPVLAYGKGGTTETVTPDTGILCKEQTSEAFGKELGNFAEFAEQVSTAILYRQADKFSKERFIAEYSRSVLAKIEDFRQHGPPLVV